MRAPRASVDVRRSDRVATVIESVVVFSLVVSFSSVSFSDTVGDAERRSVPVSAIPVSD